MNQWDFRRDWLFLVCFLGFLVLFLFALLIQAWEGALICAALVIYLAPQVWNRIRPLLRGDDRTEIDRGDPLLGKLSFWVQMLIVVALVGVPLIVWSIVNEEWVGAVVSAIAMPVSIIFAFFAHRRQQHEADS
jgi:hypothetical protein